MWSVLHRFGVTAIKKYKLLKPLIEYFGGRYRTAKNFQILFKAFERASQYVPTPKTANFLGLTIH